MERENTLSAEARAARNAYLREWRRRNPDKMRAIRNRYWEKRAGKEGEQDGEQQEHSTVFKDR